MLQRVIDTTNPPQIWPTAQRDTLRRLKLATSCISHLVSPIPDEGDLSDKLLYLKDANDIEGTIALFDTFVAMADGALLVENQPRCSELAGEYVRAEWERHTSRAYLVAHLLKEMKPDLYTIDIWTQTLVSSAFLMGHGLSDVADIVNAAVALERELRGKTATSAASKPNDPIFELIEDRDLKEDAFQDLYGKADAAECAARNAIASGNIPEHSRAEIDALVSQSDAAHEARQHANMLLSITTPTTAAGAAALLRVVLSDDPGICTPWHETALHTMAKALDTMDCRHE